MILQWHMMACNDLLRSLALHMTGRFSLKGQATDWQSRIWATVINWVQRVVDKHLS